MPTAVVSPQRLCLKEREGPHGAILFLYFPLDRMLCQPCEEALRPQASAENFQRLRENFSLDTFPVGNRLTGIFYLVEEC